MEPSAPLAPLPPPPPAPGYKRIVQTSRRLSYVNFGLKWFNSELLSDIEIFSDSKSNGNSRSFRCHQLVIYLNSPELLEAIKNRPYEDNNNTRKYIIIEDLQSKDKETELFLKSLYDPLDGENYDSFNSIYTKYNVKRYEKGLKIPQEILPQLNSENKLSDIKLNIKDSEDYVNCHRLFLAHNSEYFYGLFSSDMKDSNTRQTEISSSVLNSQEIAENIGPFTESLYYGEIARYPAEQVEKMFVGLTLSNQYLLKNRDRWKEEILHSIQTTANIAKIICNAIQYDTEDILTVTAPAMFLNAVQVVNSAGFEEIPNEYLEQVTAEYDKQNINFIQACLKSGFDTECVEALTKLLAKLGSNSPLNLQCLDNDQNTCLHLVCLEPKPKTLKFLLEQPSMIDKIDAKNSEDLTAIQICLKDTARHIVDTFGGFNTTRAKLHQQCFSGLLANGAKVTINKEEHKWALLYLLAFYSKEDPTFKTAIKIMEQNIDLKDSTNIVHYGIEPAIQNNNKTMMKYYFIKKGLEYTTSASIVEYEQFGGSIADDRGMWKDPEESIVPIDIKVKDRSTLKIDSKSINMKGAKYHWTKRARLTQRFFYSYEQDHEIEETFLCLKADGHDWEILTDKESLAANLILFFVHLNNPGYKEEVPDIFLSNSSEMALVGNAQLDSVPDLPSDPKDFAQRIIGSSTTAAINIVQKKKHK